MRRVEEPMDSRPNFAALGNEWFVGRYRVVGGWIRSQEPDPEYGDSLGSVSSRTNAKAYFPLQDPALFSSFVRLGARGAPSESKILRWVNEYGLLELEGSRMKGGLEGSPNRAPMSVEQFGSEVMQARSTMLLYRDVRYADSRNLLKRLVEMRANPTSAKAGSFSDMDRRLVLDYAGPSTLGQPMLVTARRLLEGFVESQVASVRVSLWNVAPETTKEADEWADHMYEYVPTQSWRFSDLRSAIYLQLYLIMVNAVPLKLCEHPKCRTPFPATREDKRFCTNTCRSGARRYT